MQGRGTVQAKILGGSSLVASIQPTPPPRSGGFDVHKPSHHSNLYYQRSYDHNHFAASSNAYNNNIGPPPVAAASNQSHVHHAASMPAQTSMVSLL